MDKITIFIFVSILLIPEIKAQEYYLSLGSGFTNDTITLIFNEDTLVKNEIVETNQIIGIVPSFVTIFENGILSFKKNGTIINTIDSDYKQFTFIQIIINNMPYEFGVNLKKGKYLLIDKHFYYFNVNLNQYKKIITLE